jgi:GGDEF domain-containing protein
MKNFRPTDTFGRMDGERISALYEDLKQPQDIYVIISRLQEELTGEHEISGHQLRVQPFIGAVLNDERFEDAEQILQAAIDALDRASEARTDGYLVADHFPN